MKNLANQKVKVLRIVNIQSDGIGGQSGVENVLYYNLPCNIVSATGDERDTFKKEGHVRSHTMYCGIVDIKETDVIVDANNVRYEILDVRNIRNEFLALNLSLVR